MDDKLLIYACKAARGAIVCYVLIWISSNTLEMLLVIINVFAHFD